MKWPLLLLPPVKTAWARGLALVMLACAPLAVMAAIGLSVSGSDGVPLWFRLMFFLIVYLCLAAPLSFVVLSALWVVWYLRRSRA